MKNPDKVKALKKISGYVAPTSKGTIRMVKPHQKLVLIDPENLEVSKTGKPTSKKRNSNTYSSD